MANRVRIRARGLAALLTTYKIKQSTAKQGSIKKAKSEWSLCELGEMEDIEKDIAKAFKSLIKVHIMTNEHSVEKY